MPEFIADLHIHSKYSRATSKLSDIPNLYKWAKIKGITLLGTGDFTHPGWFKELKENLIPDGNGLFNLNPELQKEIDKEIPYLKDLKVKFILSTEISSIYKKDGKVRKIHNVILVPDFETAEKFNKRLSEIGNLTADGRPILGLDAKKLLEITLEINPDNMFIPAHIWTPWFSLFGANSGFDSIEECFEDLTDEITALETGLSSDPPMNWRLSSLDKFNLVSNSDAHSPQNLAREGNLFNTSLSFASIKNALKNKNSNEFLGTIEFFPEEGKYHYDGHRKCNVRMKPKEAIKHNLICPVCGRKITIGVLHRVEELADREEGFIPPNHKKYISLVPLPEIISDAIDTGKNSKQVKNIYNHMISNIGDEMYILLKAPLDQIKKFSTDIIVEGIKRVREGRIKLIPGYDGEYGKIIIFTPEEKNRNVSQIFLLEIKKKPAEEKQNLFSVIETPREEVEYFVPENKNQKEAVESALPVAVVAGPGTGKTYTLIKKIEYLINKDKIKPEKIIAITFTNKAAEEIRERIEKELSININTGTIHSIAYNILKKAGFNLPVIDEIDAENIVREIMTKIRTRKKASGILRSIKYFKNRMEIPEDKELQKILNEYNERLDYYQVYDFEKIISTAITYLNSTEGKNYLKEISAVLVDEFQDLTRLEYEFFKSLTDNNFFVIGDPYQSIYSFRGSEGNSFEILKKDYPDLRFIYLDIDYRNTDKVLNLARTLFNVNLKSVSKGDKPVLIITPSEFSAAVQTAKIITELTGGSYMESHEISGSFETRSYKDICILVRMESQFDILEETLIQEGIPYKIYGRKSIFESENVKFILDTLKLITEPFTEFRLKQVLMNKNLSMPERIVNEITEVILNQTAEDAQKYFSDNLLPLKIVNFFKYIFSVKEKKEIPPEILISDIINFCEKDSMTERLVELSKRFKTTEKFLFTIGRNIDQEIETGGLDIERVSLMTLHSSKGLEFPVVIIFEVNDGIIPLLKHGETNIEEEKRLLYVGLTRASEKLYLIYPEKVQIRNKIQKTSLSRFLPGINHKFYNIKKIKFKRKEKLEQLKLW